MLSYTFNDICENYLESWLEPRNSLLVIENKMMMFHMNVLYE